MGGYGGFLLATNVSTLWVQQISLDNDTGKITESLVKNVSLADANLSWEWVTAVDMNVVPIITLDSKEIYIFDDPQNDTIPASELGRESEDKLKTFDGTGAKCASWFSDESGVSWKDRKNKWKRFLVSQDNENHTISRFVPYPRFAYSRPEEALLNMLPSYYLDQNERTPYSCTAMDSKGAKMEEYKQYWSKTRDIFALNAQHFVCSLDGMDFGLYASAITSSAYAVTSARIDPTSWILKAPNFELIADVPKAQPLVRTENMLLRFVPKRGNFQDRIEPINLNLKEKVDGIDTTSLGESTVLSIATDGKSTVLVAEIDNVNHLFVSRTLQEDLEEVDLGFTPRIVLYGQSTDIRTHYTENITYDDINKSAGFSDPIPDSAEWAKV